ncbi:MAG: rRNA maturation RNase YbeY [Sulfurihydrogenibium sp.]|jgi:probable rRNA maturation factor|uniref:Endoribonuclease YbeY n=1 Tax=Sulfurihydrogenibium azorense TaxID=309806 RepID=A0A832DQZ6_9AQUI|nr:MAG: rRNA maturation RNase YbeY [Sulfurihydrogenibium sp.]PMP77145.1 MAG: rRNA maturation RNase YbeY [Sulfurihydrogenibium sp.]HEV09589.1 rRNA maturation RNase YbeY [Sulfurihydrogenibium azorense]
MNRILVNKQVYDREITKSFVKEATKQIIKNLNLDGVEVSITLTDDETIRSINKQWRGKDKPTDVLSFPQGDTVGYRYRVLGDVIISLPYARRQAEEIGYSYKEEVVRLLTHGILHLLGYDHETSEEDAKVMFELQDKIYQNVIYELQSP